MVASRVFGPHCAMSRAASLIVANWREHRVLGIPSFILFPWERISPKLDAISLVVCIEYVI